MRLKNLFKDFLLPIGILSGTIIGAGVFSLPYAVEKVGWLSGFLYLFVFSFVFVILHLMYADVVLGVGDGKPMFAAYAGKLLGRWAFIPSFFIVAAGMLLTLTIYLILSSKFGELAFFSSGGNFFVLLFWLLGSAMVFIDLKKLALGELLVTALILIIIAAVFILGFRELGNSGWSFFAKEKSFTLGWANLILPFGPLLFSLAGRSAMPEVVLYVEKYKKPILSLRKIVFWGTFIPAVAYALFILGVFGLSPRVSQDSISGVAYGSFPIAALLGFLGLLSIFSTYVVLATTLKEMFKNDLGAPSFISGFLVVILPLFFYLAVFHNFFGLVSVVGGVFLALENIFVLLMWRRLGRWNLKSSLLGKAGNVAAPLVLIILITGLFYEIFKGFIH